MLGGFGSLIPSVAVNIHCGHHPGVSLCATVRLNCGGVAVGNLRYNSFICADPQLSTCSKYFYYQFVKRMSPLLFDRKEAILLDLQKRRIICPPSSLVTGKSARKCAGDAHAKLLRYLRHGARCSCIFTTKFGKWMTAVAVSCYGNTPLNRCISRAVY